jgi:hypothetical protein
MIFPEANSSVKREKRIFGDPIKSELSLTALTFFPNFGQGDRRPNHRLDPIQAPLKADQPPRADDARPRQIEVNSGDKILIRANDKRLGLMDRY